MTPDGDPDMFSRFAVAFALTLFAGMATAIGSAIAFFVKQTHYRMLAMCLAFAAGVMLYVSFVEILPKSHENISSIFEGKSAAWITAAAFFGGMIFIGVIDRLIPTLQNPHEPRRPSDLAQIKQAEEPADWADSPASRVHLHRMGLFTAIAIAIHNFPEGLVTFLTALDDPALGVAIAIAIALHNIPEGVSVSVPIYYATGSRKRAFIYSVLSGLAEPVGALIGIGLLMMLVPLNGAVLGILFAGVAGIMVFISLDELLPTAQRYSKGHETIYGIVIGMALMALSLLLLQ
jgi:zinc transporter, ZIP family